MLQFDSGTPENRTQRYARWVVRHRWWVLAITLFATLLAGSGIRKLGLATDYRTFFSEDNPDLAAYEAVENIYTKNDNVLFVIRPAEGRCSRRACWPWYGI
jgi:predicted RND superfamily exporter protein